MMPFAIIPARGGSKGIPRKNLAKVGGVSLVGRSILAAQKSEIFDVIYVSTDDPEIAQAAEKFGAKAIMRPIALSQDTSSSEDALLNVLSQLEFASTKLADEFFFIQCTSPLLSAEDLRRGYEVFQKGSYDCLFSASEFFHFVWNYDSTDNVPGKVTGNAIGNASGSATAINHDASVRLPRQQRQGQVIENGAFYILKTQKFKDAKHRFFGKIGVAKMDASRSLEIDDPLDLTVAEVLIRQADRDRHLHLLPTKIQALVLDFDGVFTDDGVYVNQDGSEAVVCSRSDGMGLSQLKKTGLPIVILSTEKNPVVSARAQKLGLPVIQGLDDKAQALTQWAKENSLALENIIYVGNDINDLGCFRLVGCPVAVANAHPNVQKDAQIVLLAAGGHGAIREIVDLIQKRRPRE